MTQQIFDQMIGEPPPSTVDVDRVMARERRSARRRRVAGAGTAGLLAIGLVFGAVTYLAGAGAPAPLPAAAATSPSAPTPWPPDAVAAMEREMREVVPRVAPGAQLSDVRRSGPWGQVGIPKMTGMPDGIIGAEAYGTSMTVELGGRRRILVIDVYRFYDGRDFPGCGAGQQGCEEIITPEGWRMTINATVFPTEAGSTLIDAILSVDRGNGVRVLVFTGSDVPLDEPYLHPAPLTLDQLKQIALDPALVPST
jgi:hypothetical protein